MSDVAAERRGEPAEAGQRALVPADQLRGAGADVGDRAVAVELQLEDPVGMIERLAEESGCQRDDARL